MHSEDFKFISKFLKDRSGLVVTEDKKYLLETRLQPICRHNGYPDIAALITVLRGIIPPANLVQEVVEAMTTNESMFFRDNRPFEQLKTHILPNMLAKKGADKRLRVWSAACSNGQEPYSLAMTFREEKALLGSYNFDIQATDLDNQVLAKARLGIYTQFEIQRGLPIKLLLAYFEQRENNQWQAKQELRQMINYQKLNLLDNFSSMGKFDMIFCRNVLIYFDEETKRNVLERLSACLHPHGILFLGSAETTIGITTALKPVADVRGAFSL